MYSTPFAVDELEVDVLEPRVEMTQVGLESTCYLINGGIIPAVENAARAEIRQLTYSTCYPG